MASNRLLICVSLFAVLSLQHVANARHPVWRPVPTCDDGLPCTTNDSQQAGVCAGTLQGDVEVLVELSPTMVPWPIERCIVLEFFKDCVHAPVQCSTTIQFGDPLTPGLGTGVITVGAECPIDRVFAVTALDPLHTLRATGELTCNGTNLLVIFEGDPAEGGNWLIGGNLDAWNPGASFTDANSINIVDFGIFFSQYRTGATYPDGDTTCSTPGPHADINGDGVVNVVDYFFISTNFNSTSNGPCLSLGGAIGGAPLTEISIKELYDRGLGDLAVADLNEDGRVDVDDMTAFLQGIRPPPPSLSRAKPSRQAIERR